MTNEQIQQRAHEIWRERVERGIDGTPEGDWEVAEWELSPGQPLDWGAAERELLLEPLESED